MSAPFDIAPITPPGAYDPLFSSALTLFASSSESSVTVKAAVILALCAIIRHLYSKEIKYYIPLNDHGPHHLYKPITCEERIMMEII